MQIAADNVVVKRAAHTVHSGTARRRAELQTNDSRAVRGDRAATEYPHVAPWYTIVGTSHQRHRGVCVCVSCRLHVASATEFIHLASRAHIPVPRLLE